MAVIEKSIQDMQEALGDEVVALVAPNIFGHPNHPDVIRLYLSKFHPEYTAYWLHFDSQKYRIVIP